MPSQSMSEARPGARLPVELTAFIGRERELEATRGLLLDTRCLTLTGVGGAGKTRLAVELASSLERAFGGGAVFVDLAPITAPASVASAVAQGVGVVVGGRPHTRDALVRALRDVHLLLVLDNCEHVAAACAELIETLLKACPDLRVVATSRRPLDVAGEVSFALPPLATPSSEARLTTSEAKAFDAVRLFLERAAAVRPGLQLGPDGVASVAAICRRLDGLPLAIELAAARVRSLSPHEIERRLGQSLRLLSRGARTAPARQQTLRATIDWSHALLDDSERILFRRLAVFSGGWTLEHAERVCAFDPLDDDLLDLHERVLAQSLIVCDVPEPVITRYRFLETIRQYAAERLVDAGELDEMRNRHLRCFLEEAERYDAERTRKGSDAGLPALTRERDNLRAALSWAVDTDAEAALRLTVALDDVWHMIAPAEGWEWLQRTLEPAGSGSGHRARALVLAGKLAGYVSAYAEGAGLLREARELAEASADEPLAAAADLWSGRLALFAEDPARASEQLGRALTGMEALAIPLGRVRALSLLGLLEAVVLQRPAEGEPKLVAAAELAHSIGDSWGEGYAHMMLSICAADARDRARVRRHAVRALSTPSIAPLHGVPLQQLARAVVDDDPGRALLLLGAASARLHRFGTEEPEFLARRAEHARHRAEELAGAGTAQRLFDEGRDLAPSEVQELVDGTGAERRAQRPGGLSPRELQVAALVGRHLSNRDVARALFISVRTAESHVEHILAKLTLGNRLELAAWASANGLPGAEPSTIP
jgi:non-specific serine/threonine protein kinase